MVTAISQDAATNKERYRVKSTHSLRKSENPNRRDATLTAGRGEAYPSPSSCHLLLPSVRSFNFILPDHQTKKFFKEAEDELRLMFYRIFRETQVRNFIS